MLQQPLDAETGARQALAEQGDSDIANTFILNEEMSQSQVSVAGMGTQILGIHGDLARKLG